MASVIMNWWRNMHGVSAIISSALPDGTYIVDGTGKYIVDGSGAFIVDGT